jgi:putative flippase GtrA
MKYRLDFNKLLDLKIIKFLIAGVLNTLFGYFIYAVLLVIKTPYLAALFVATVAGVVFNYFSFGRIVFNGLSGWLIYVKFFSAYTIIYSINAAFLGLLTEYFLFSPYIGQLLCIPIGVALSWLIMNYWVYKND